MCYFITVSIPDSGVEILKSEMPRELHLIETSNPSITPHIPENYISYVVTTDGCSCDLFSEESGDDEITKRINKLQRKYKRKGWSDSKIKRAIDQSISAAQSPKAVGLRNDLLFYLSDVLNLLGEMMLIVHWYNGDVETEKVLIRNKLKISTDLFKSDNPVRQIDTLFVLN